MLNNTCFVIIKTNDRGALAPTISPFLMMTKP